MSSDTNVGCGPDSSSSRETLSRYSPAQPFLVTDPQKATKVCLFDRNERHKPEHRSSSQGPLSSIRAVIKRSLMTSVQHNAPRKSFSDLYSE